MKVYINNHDVQNFDLSLLGIDINSESNLVKKLKQRK